LEKDGRNRVLLAEICNMTEFGRTPFFMASEFADIDIAW